MPFAPPPPLQPTYTPSSALLDWQLGWPGQLALIWSGLGHFMADISTRCLARLCSAGYNGNKARIVGAAVPHLATEGWLTTEADVHPIGAPNPAVEGGVEGFVIRAVSASDPEDATAIVIIRGTRSEAEWKASYEYALAPLPLPAEDDVHASLWSGLRPHCHAGFMRMWEPIAEDLRGIMVSLRCQTWLFCGNSRGGAMATIMAVDCGTRLLPHLHSVTESRTSTLKDAALAKARAAAAASELACARARAAAARAVAAASGASARAAANASRAAGAADRAEASASMAVASVAALSVAEASTRSAASAVVPRLQCVTFASPRAGNGAFVQLHRRVMVLYAARRACPLPTAGSAIQSRRDATGAAARERLAALPCVEKRDASVSSHVASAVKESRSAGATLGRCERWVVGRDMVPTLPPAVIGYRHVGGCRYVGKLVPGHVPTRADGFSVVGALVTHATRGPSDDHNIDRLLAWFDAEHAAGRKPWSTGS